MTATELSAVTQRSEASAVLTCFIGKEFHKFMLGVPEKVFAQSLKGLVAVAPPTPEGEDSNFGGFLATACFTHAIEQGDNASASDLYPDFIKEFMQNYHSEIAPTKDQQLQNLIAIGAARNVEFPAVGTTSSIPPPSGISGGAPVVAASSPLVTTAPSVRPSPMLAASSRVSASRQKPSLLPTETVPRSETFAGRFLTEEGQPSGCAELG